MLFVCLSKRCNDECTKNCSTENIMSKKGEERSYRLNS